MALRYDGKTEIDDLEEKTAFDHRNDGSGLQNSISHVVGQDAVDAAKEGTHAQQIMTSMDALRRYPVATAFSILYSTAIVMEGYDLVVINSFYGQPQFQRYVSLDLLSDPMCVDLTPFTVRLLQQCHEPLLYFSDMADRPRTSSANRIHHWSSHKWLHDRSLRLPQNHARCSCSYDSLHFCYLLRSKSGHAAHRRIPLRESHERKARCHC